MSWIAPLQGGGDVRVPAAPFFADAHRRALPSFETEHSWTGVPMEFLAYRVLREA